MSDNSCHMCGRSCRDTGTLFYRQGQWTCGELGCAAPSRASFCEETGRPRYECRCWHCADTKGPETERIPPSVPAPLPCKLTYYGIDCTGCDAHPRGLTVDEVRRMRRHR